MLSVLVCSVNPVFLQQFQRNVEETIGIPYEVIVFDNREEKKGICEVYNTLATRSVYDHLCFVHEDVVFTTYNWGQQLFKTFHDEKAGLIGVAGSKYKSAMYSGWFTGIKQYDCANIIHRYKDGEEHIFLQPDADVSIENVVTIDGVFMACRKEVWQQVQFDQENIRGFHLYDLDFSLRAAFKTRVVVDYNILLVHITSGGNYSDDWMKASIAFHRRYPNLPFPEKTSGVTEDDIKIARTNLDFLKKYRISWQYKMQWIKFQGLYKYNTLYYSLIKFLLYQPLQMKKVHHFLKSK